MSQPTPYARQANYTDWSAAYPTAPHSGVSMDADFNAAALTLSGILANLALIQRDDGKVANASINLEQLGTGVLALFASTAGWKPRGLWLTATAYVVGDFVASGTGSYVCAVAHTGGVFATDKAAGKWILLFDTAGVTPGDGTVTAAKLAAGSVTAPAIGFTALDLTGSVHAQGGLAAGTAPGGALLHAKQAAGATYGKIERTTDVQGAVGYQIIGVGATWTLEQAAASSTLALRLGAVVSVTFTALGGSDTSGTVRALAGVVPIAGVGVGLSFGAAGGKLAAYDYDAVLWRDIKVQGLNTYLTAGGIDVLKATATGVDVTGLLTQNAIAVGYLGIPGNTQSAAYTIALADAGKDIYSENTAGQTVVIPTNAVLALGQGFTVSITNDGTTAITVDTTGVVVRLAGTSTVTGNRTIAAGGQALLRKVKSPDRWWIGGVGVS